jgi:hypothetical protein
VWKRRSVEAAEAALKVEAQAAEAERGSGGGSVEAAEVAWKRRRQRGSGGGSVEARRRQRGSAAEAAWKRRSVEAAAMEAGLRWCGNGGAWKRRRQR